MLPPAPCAGDELACVDSVFEQRGDKVMLEGTTVQTREPRAGVQPQPQSNMRLMQGLIQRLNPQLHHWNHNTVFAIDAMADPRRAPQWFAAEVMPAFTQR